MAANPSERPRMTGSRRVCVNAMSTMSPTRRSSGWMVAVSVPSSMASSRLLSLRSTVNFFPVASTSITWSPRMMRNLWIASVSVSGFQLRTILPVDAIPCGDKIFTADSK